MAQPLAYGIHPEEHSVSIKDLYMALCPLEEELFDSMNPKVEQE